MARVVWTVLESAQPMGQQVYESRLAAETRNLAAERHGFATRIVGPLRSPGENVRRIPMRLLGNLPLPAAQLIGRSLVGGGDLVHRMDLRIPPSGRLEVVTVHDLPPLRFDDEGKMPRWSLASVAASAGVISPSSFARSEVMAFAAPRRSWVIPQGVEEIFSTSEPLTTDELRKSGIAGPYVMHLAGATKRKNLEALAGAWGRIAASHPDLHLVLCGPPDERRTRLFELQPRTILTGRLEPTAVAKLLRGALMVVVPSIYEGFGLPVVEAMSAGAPVVAVRRGALPEVCADAAVLVEPSPDAIAAGVMVLLDDAEARQRLAALGRRRAGSFTWAKCASAHLDVYDELLSEPPPI